MKQFERYEIWLQTVRDNAPHFKDRDLMCDVPWPHLAALLAERDRYMTTVILCKDGIERVHAKLDQLGFPRVGNLERSNPPSQERPLDETGRSAADNLMAQAMFYQSNRASDPLAPYESCDYSEGEGVRSSLSDEIEAWKRWELEEPDWGNVDLSQLPEGEVPEGVAPYEEGMDIRAGNGTPDSVFPREEVYQRDGQDTEPPPGDNQRENPQPSHAAAQSSTQEVKDEETFAEIRRTLEESSGGYTIISDCGPEPEFIIKEISSRGVETPWKNYTPGELDKASGSSVQPSDDEDEEGVKHNPSNLFQQPINPLGD